MIKDIIVNLSVAKNGSTVRNYAVSVAAALQAHLTGIAFVYDPIVPMLRWRLHSRRSHRKFSAPTTKRPLNPRSRISPQRPTAPGFQPSR